MRLAHLADLHLGFRQFHRLTERGHNQREADVALAFTRAIDGVIDARPDAVLVAGDLFHTVRPTNAAILHAVREFNRIRRELPDAPIVVIAGNHDTPRSSDTTSIFGLLHEIGVHVAADQPRRFDFPEHDLSVLAVPHGAFFGDQRPAIEPRGTRRYQVAMLHGEVPGLFPDDPERWDPDGARLRAEELNGAWQYLALGHYHVQHQYHPRCWYSGSLEYVSTRPWTELRETRSRDAKGWLLVDLDRESVASHPIAPPRRFIDLPWLDAHDMTPAEVDRLLAGAMAEAGGGIEGAVVRQVVNNVARPVARELDHAQIRAWKAAALHLHLDLRPPLPVSRIVGVGAPGHRQTLPEMLESFLAARTLPPGIDPARFVARGAALLADAGSEAEE